MGCGIEEVIWRVGPAILFDQIFWAQNHLDQTFFGHKLFPYPKLLYPNIFEPNIFWQNFFWDQKFVGLYILD